ncbi:MAG: penicillin-binding protein 2 [Thermoleophilia bacterium]|nr:penicillin-binding protein 2 [Thermoleophilia bacterium]
MKSNMSDSPYGEQRSASRRFLEPERGVEAPYRFTPGLALRVGVLGALALTLFAVLLVRLWSLQVLSGDRYLEAAQSNQLRMIEVDAPRGTVVDRKGRVIVDNIPGTAIELWVGDLPQHGRFAVIRHLALALGVSPRALANEVDARLGNPLEPIVAKTAVTEAQVAYLYEHLDELPGVQIRQTYLRHYPYGSLGAQMLGYVGEISPEELKRMEADGYRPGDRIGKAGVEGSFDAYLRGVPGEAEIRVDSLGRPQSALELRKEARPGNTLRLTLDLALQQAAERALQHGIALAKQSKAWYANGGALIALDPRDGAVLALASYPTYTPSVYVGRVDPKRIEPLIDDDAARAANWPGLNRVTQAEYPPGSTWKPVTAIAAMQEHILGAYESLACTPSAAYGADRFVFRNWDSAINKRIALVEALARSCDTYFYEVGYRFYRGGDAGRNRMQEWAARFGFGLPTGLGIGAEAAGLVPTPSWRKETFTNDWDRAWNPGDSIQLAIGQKEVRVTPLQMARFYAAIANGGSLVTPYLVQSVETPSGSGRSSLVVRRFAPSPPAATGADPAALRVVRDGLVSATHAEHGTSAGVFGAYPVSIAGKTGTAEKVVRIPGYPAGHMEDQSWWCGFGPSDAEARIVVCAVIENGGHGSTAAAPAALEVIEEFFGVKAKQKVLVATD